MHLLNVVLLLAASISILNGQDFDILLKGGHVIDPKNEINSVMDIAIKDGKIAEVAENLSVDRSSKVVDVTGLYVTPGLIDMHAHVFHGTDVD